MQNYSRAPQEGANRTYVSTFEEMHPPPDYEQRPETHQHVVSDTTIGLVIVSANLLLTLIIIVGAMVGGGTSPGVAMVIGAAYFGLTTPFYILIITGALTAMISVTQRERTERLRIEAYRQLGELAVEWRMAVEANRATELRGEDAPETLQRRIGALEASELARKADIGQIHRTSPINTFVAPFTNVSEAAFASATNTVTKEAIHWAMALYDDVGQPNAKKVQLAGDASSLGRLRVRMIGSKRGHGSREAGLWLLHHGVIGKVAGGYRLNLAKFPTRETLRSLV
jgi:hypothetical protein